MKFPSSRFQFIQKIFDTVHADIAFFAGLGNAASDFVPVEFFPSAVFLDNHQGDFFNPFIGRKAPVACQAFPSPPYHIPFLAQPGVNDFIFRICAKRTFHSAHSLKYPTRGTLHQQST
jgi:hypothetical protein